MKQPKTFYGYKIDASEPFELQIHLPLDYDVKAGQVIRIGHMGNNAREDKVREVFAALDGTFNKLGITLKSSMEQIFADSLKDCQ